MSATTPTEEPMEDTIYVGDLRAAEVLAALYNSARAQGMGWLHFTSDPMTTDEAQAVLDEEEAREWFDYREDTHNPGRYFDYLRGRVMKVMIGGDTLDPRLYDRDNGAGAALRAIEAQRAKAHDRAATP
jgi:hypothetical protein